MSNKTKLAPAAEIIEQPDGKRTLKLTLEDLDAEELDQLKAGKGFPVRVGADTKGVGVYADFTVGKS
jgi:hypothetical protein